jgi:hypothetical protein
MKKLLLLSVFTAQLASAQTFHDWDNPSKKFDLGNTTKTFSLVIKSTDDVQKICEAESKNRGHGGFGFQVNSCAFWNTEQTECTIVTPKRSSMHLLGHELLHCLKGNWH